MTCWCSTEIGITEGETSKTVFSPLYCGTSSYFPEDEKIKLVTKIAQQKLRAQPKTWTMQPETQASFLKFNMFNCHLTGVVPQGMDLKLKTPSASDTAWQRGFLSPDASPNPWGQSTMETSSECKYIWTPSIGFPYKRKQNDFCQMLRIEDSRQVLNGREPNELNATPIAVIMTEILLMKAEEGKKTE